MGKVSPPTAESPPASSAGASGVPPPSKAFPDVASLSASPLASPPVVAPLSNPAAPPAPDASVPFPPLDPPLEPAGELESLHPANAVRPVARSKPSAPVAKRDPRRVGGAAQRGDGSM